MDYDQLLANAFQSINTPLPPGKTALRPVFSFTLNDVVAGYSTRKDGVVYLIITSWWDPHSRKWGYESWRTLNFCEEWLNFSKVDIHGIRYPKPQKTKSLAMALLPGKTLKLDWYNNDPRVIYIDPSAPKHERDPMDQFVIDHENCESSLSVLTSASGKSSELVVCRYLEVFDD